MVAQFGARGISKRTLFEEYLMIEVPVILHEWKLRDEMMQMGGLSMFGGVPAAPGRGGGGYDYLAEENQKFDAGAFEQLRMLTGGSA